MNTRLVTGRAAAALLAVVLGGAVLAGCSQSTNEQVVKPSPSGSVEEETVTVSTTVTVPADGASDSDSDDQGASADKPEPEVSSSKSIGEAHNEAIAKANELSDPGSADSWIVNDSNFDPTSDLSYVSMNLEQSPRAGMLVALFHKGEFVQFASDTPGRAVYAKPASEGVEVHYSDTEAFLASGEPLANSSNYTVPVTYYWDGSGVSHRGEIPPEPSY